MSRRLKTTLTASARWSPFFILPAPTTTWCTWPCATAPTCASWPCRRLPSARRWRILKRSSSLPTAAATSCPSIWIWKDRTERPQKSPPVAGFCNGPCCSLRSGRLGHFAQKVVQNAAVAVVAGFLERDQADVGPEALFRALGAGGGHIKRFLCAVGQALDVKGFRAVQAQAFGILAVFKGQRQNAHADQVGAVNTLVGFSNNGLDAQQQGALGGPVARRTRTVFLAGNDHQRGVVLLVRSEEHTSELQSRGHLVCRLLLEKKKNDT